MPKEKIIRPYKSEFLSSDTTMNTVEYFVIIPALDPAFKFISDKNLLNSIIWFSETAGVSWHKGKQDKTISGLGL